MSRLLRMSKFNYQTFDQAGNLILYNFLAGLPSLTKILKKDVNKFITLLGGDQIDPTTLQNYSSAIHDLIEAGILVDYCADENVLYTAKYFQDIFENKLFLFLLPTGRCNFSCVYCFENYEPFSRNTMSIEAQQAIINYVQRHIHEFKALHVSWFGGEPLLEPQIINYLSTNFINICRKRHIPYSAEITTNGYYLDNDMFDLLYNLKVYHYKITIDGFKEQHDKQRPLRNSEGTYDTIMKNLLNIHNRKEYKFANIQIRINMTRNFLDILDDFIAYIDSTFSDDPRFSFQFSTAMDFSNTKSSENSLYIDYPEVLPQLMNNTIYANKYYTEEQKLSPIDAGNRCVANLKNSYVITPNLTVHKCYSHYELESNRIGVINAKGDLIVDDAIHRKWYLDNSFMQRISETCKNCYYLPACHQGNKVCPVRYLKSVPDNQPCPIENETFRAKISEAVQYAATKYPYRTLYL